MKIELCEDNSFLNDGKPTLVVLVITHDNGGQVRIPYEATKTIQELYADVRKMKNPDNSVKVVEVERKEDTKPRDIVGDLIVDAFGGIEKEDIVKCIHLEPDLDGNTNDELELGKEYRVLSILKSKGVKIGFEVIDDDTKMRIQGLTKEFALVRKHEKPPPKMPNEEVKKALSGKTDEELAELTG
jgi:hypothetical protein